MYNVGDAQSHKWKYVLQRNYYIIIIITIIIIIIIIIHLFLIKEIYIGAIYINICSCPKLINIQKCSYRLILPGSANTNTLIIVVTQCLTRVGHQKA